MAKASDNDDQKALKAKKAKKALTAMQILRLHSDNTSQLKKEISC